ncbi:GNAT family N-acetyltransferase [Kineosporia sp. R_H_3]|uniref:GNAT family N-acetyltransferase n=1 Tax=Kineosporia sp. R_H_3 TaxID=1961848 RepID=UPI001E2E869E|nr:GNAT family N-acetyltransferase [Kineosporia sp. R_H_3]
MAGVLEPVRGLSPDHLDAVAALEREVVAADGGRLKLEWGTLRSRSGEDVEDLLWWDGDRLVGFLGVYAFGGPFGELGGMVAPAARRRGIGTALVDAALPLCAARGIDRVLLVTPRTTPAGAAFARARGAVLDHSEHALQLTGPPADGPQDPRISLRPMRSDAADGAAVDALLRGAFGAHGPDFSVADDSERARRLRAETVVAERDGTVVGCLRLTRTDDVAGVYGFAVRPDLQGQGIGRDVLRRTCRQALADGAALVHLEVEVANERALGLYTSLGFAPVSTEDYFLLP